MQSDELRRLIVRHRHVAPMVSVLLAATDVRVRITDLAGKVLLDRESRSAAADAPVDRHPITVEGKPVGWVEGPRPAGAVAAVLSYACSREADKRSLSSEALDRYRELNLVYDLAERLVASPHLAEVAEVAMAEAGRLPSGGVGFLLLEDAATGTLVPSSGGEAPSPFSAAPGAEGLLGAIFAGDPAIVNDVSADPRSSAGERSAASSLVIAPLKVEDARLGVIGAASTAPSAYQASDLKVLGAIAALAAPAIVQAQRYELATRARD